MTNSEIISAYEEDTHSLLSAFAKDALSKALDKAREDERELDRLEALRKAFDHSVFTDRHAVP